MTSRTAQQLILDAIASIERERLGPLTTMKLADAMVNLHDAVALLASATPVAEQQRPTVGEALDSLQIAFNNGAFLCPLVGKAKPDEHSHWCQACRVRSWLELAGRYVRAESEITVIR